MYPDLKYLGYFIFKDYKWGSVTSVSIDPASINKIFYADYLFSEFTKDQLESIKLNIDWQSFIKYKRGTVKLSIKDVNSRFSLKKLVDFSINQSCNISTGILADYLVREKVNEQIKKKLGLLNTFIDSPKTMNHTSIIDLWKYSRHLAVSKVDSKIKELLMMDKRRSIVKDSLPIEAKVYSKGGTTFQGLRRDWGFFELNNEIGYFCIVQIQDVAVNYSMIDKILARVHLGKLHNHLVYFNEDFSRKVSEITTEMPKPHS